MLLTLKRHTILHPAYKKCGDWLPWGACSATCGEGLRLQQQTCHLQDTLLKKIREARKGAVNGMLLQEEIDAFPAWYWNISLSIQRYGIESCQEEACPSKDVLVARTALLDNV